MFASVVAAVFVFAPQAHVQGEPQQAPEGTGMPPSVVLISVDGVQKAALKRALIWTEKNEDGSPALCWTYRHAKRYPTNTGELDENGAPIYSCMPALYREFTLIDSRTCDGKTMTKPQHVCMLTGLTQQQSGVTGNRSSKSIPYKSSIFDIMAAHFEPLPHGERHRELPVRTTMVSWRRFVGRPVAIWADRSRALQFQKGHGAKVHMPTRQTLRMWDRLQDDEYPDTQIFSFLHYKVIDWAGHLSGTGSRGYHRHLISIDEQIRRLLKELDDRGWGHAAVIITTDHGFPEKASQHATRSGDGAPTEDFSISDIWMAFRNDPHYAFADRVEENGSTRTPEITDITPTILDIFGVPVPKNLTGTSLLE
jgi:hypothetical protein